MKTKPRSLHVFFIVMSLAMLALVTSACSFFTYRLGEISQVVDISLDEELFNQSAPTFTVHGYDFWDGLLVDVDRMELHDGYLRFLGTRILPDGSRMDASIDLSLGAENGNLTARVIAVDIPGIKLTDPVIIRINQDLKADLRFEDYDPHADVQFQEVQVTENALRMKILVDLRF
jgi:hypothetical protein